MPAELHLVDAFTSSPFRGNVAGVCIPDGPPDAEWMQKVAAELKHSETAFLLPAKENWNLRWFTPAQEVELCGHATLAAAFVLWTTGRVPRDKAIAFETLSGTLTVRQSGDWISMDFPAEPATASGPVPGLGRALGIDPLYVARNRFDILAELPSADDVCSLEPDLNALAAIPARGIIVTAASDLPHFDFVSRFFAPAVGVTEDPVTGSAHCCLGPYWGEKLKKTDLDGFQCSARGGTVKITLQGDRVILGGHAVHISSGRLLV
ncbi:PhzF family phenazine biosynthesis protein [uncultured Methanoregula sp.]|uniref:PhzF family phenazine biosynthesis protein n=1 Tax=uncultured Methanoregula sp. TaxID=1005933 RepID=UPI002AAB7E36|nr:PhzF family phenazine biosynthesis protein [uncultured Methanoregula sp.]